MDDERGLLVELRSEADLEGAIRALRGAGYTRLEAHTPFASERVLSALGTSRGSLPSITLAASVLGAVAAYAVQWWTQTRAYPLNVGGRPLHAWPAFVPITFEAMVLLGALATFAGFFVLSGLPRLWRPLFEVDGFERASIDRFFLRVAEADPRYDPAAALELIDRFEPVRVTVLTGEEP